jgi:hypothetical protein
VDIGIHGTEPDREDDPLYVIPPKPLDVPALAGPLNKDRREDLQILSFALAISLTVDGGHPIEIRPGGDPPDRFIRVNGRAQSVELTELTVFDVRREFAQARKLGRDLRERLRTVASRYTHLVGRLVVISVLPGEPLPGDTKILLDNICVLLEKDQGCVGDGVDLTKGLPDPWPNDRGFYGQSGPVHVQVYRDGLPNEIFVSGAHQANIRLSQAIHVLESRVRAKDTPPNEILVMSCGLPDDRGYRCGPDSFIFEFISKHRDRLQLSPQHLKSIFLHHWGTSAWLQLYRSEESPPWPPIPTGGRPAV